MRKLVKALAILTVLAAAIGMTSCDSVLDIFRLSEANGMLGHRPLNYKETDLAREIQNVFSGDHVKNETVMFIDKGDTKELLYKIDKVISVTSYNGKITYVEGEDYEVAGGKEPFPERNCEDRKFRHKSE